MHKLYSSIVIALFIAISAYGASFHTARAPFLQQLVSSVQSHAEL